MALTTEFIDEGEHLKVVTSESSKKLKRLKAGIYRIVQCEEGGYKLKKLEHRFAKKGKMYGKEIPALTDIILSHFKRSEDPVGLLALGKKGCGKSLLCETISNAAMDTLDMPVLMLDEALPKAIVSNALKAARPCVLFIDEYEKIYKPDYRQNGKEQKPDADELLTVFSDKNMGQVLTLVAANRKQDISPYILDRPERFLYRVEHGKVDNEVVEEICDDYKLHKDVKSYIVEYAEDTNANLDTVITLAKNSTSFTKPTQLRNIFKYLNVVKPRQWGWCVYTVSGQPEGIKAETERKNLVLTIPGLKEPLIINYDTFHRKLQWNREYSCFVPNGLGAGGSSQNVLIGINSTGPIGEDEKDTVEFFKLNLPNNKGDVGAK